LASDLKVPALGGVPTGLDPQLNKFLKAVKEQLETAYGLRGSAGFAGIQQLLNSGAITQNPDGSYSGGSTVGEGFQNQTPPPSPLGVSASGGFATVILQWDQATYSNPGYAEILRSVTDDLSTATVIGQTPGTVFSDAVGNSFTGYYWVRFVSQAGVTGPVDTPLGHSASTSLDPTYAMDVLASVYGNAPFYVTTTTTTQNGQSVPPGVYIKNGYIANGTIVTAMIGLAQIDNALIGNAAIGTANIATGSITTALIGTAQITTALIATGAITNAVIANGTILAANIANGAITNAQIANGTITNAQIASGTITNAQIASGTITNANIGTGQITNANIANGTITSAQIASATITQANMASASIGNAQIQSAAIANANIQNAAVNTLTIQGQAVTVQASYGISSNGSVGYSSSGGTLMILFTAGFPSGGGTGTLYVNGSALITVSGNTTQTGFGFTTPGAGGVTISTGGTYTGSANVGVFEAKR
jgi:hypothetical protein